MIVAQVTDPHITLPGTLLHGGYDPDAALGAVLSRILELQPLPDLVFFTGDLTQNGLPEEYANFKRLLSGFPLPCAAIPGNHDRRDAFFAAFDGTDLTIGPDSSYLHLSIPGHPLGLIGLDSLGLEGQPGGELDETRLRWLERRLEELGPKPTLIFLHHPPFATSLGSIDRSALAEPEALAEIVAAHPSVLRVSAGHVHRSVETRWAGTVAGICPSVAWQFPLLDGDAPLGMIPQAPAFQLHLWSEAQGLVTHTEFLARDR